METGLTIVKIVEWGTSLAKSLRGAMRGETIFKGICALSLVTIASSNLYSEWVNYQWRYNSDQRADEEDERIRATMSEVWTGFYGSIQQQIQESEVTSKAEQQRNRQLTLLQKATRQTIIIRNCRTVTWSTLTVLEEIPVLWTGNSRVQEEYNAFIAALELPNEEVLRVFETLLREMARSIDAQVPVTRTVRGVACG